ncbi:huntingtin-associated protein 1 [Geospiza fortis]|uniref:Huntingtin-associated protein 1 n=1 Tax=Geospiza fortis TaxID=48883 RepID=A0A8N5F4B9_GEOFO|nr:huntingtin-associated protein 1 [Geospiza fortis]
MPRPSPVGTAERASGPRGSWVLCAERVARITKTYHDIDAVTNLLDEKERDLELAARIGQSLLKQNRSLTERNELLEEQLELAKEEIAQLRHEVSMRDDLLHFYTTTTEESEPTTTTSTPLRRRESSLSLQQYFQYDTLQQKLRSLEEENQKLRMEATSIATETCEYEQQEQQLMIDCVEQFSEASQQVVHLSEELARRTPSTFTITTCHILHPTTAITTVTPSLYHAVVPSCGPFEGLSLCSPSPELAPPTLALGPGPPSTPRGPFRLLLGRDSHLAPGTGSWWAPSLHGQDHQHCEPPVPRGQRGAPGRSSTFSWNLVEKLQRLGLDKVVTRGESSCAQPGPRGAWGTQK